MGFSSRSLACSALLIVEWRFPSDSLWDEFTLFGGKVEGDGHSDILWTHVSVLSYYRIIVLWREITALRQTGPFRLLLRKLVEAGRGKLKWHAWVVRLDPGLPSAGAAPRWAPLITMGLDGWSNF